MDILTRFFSRLQNEDNSPFIEHEIPYPNVMVIRHLVNEKFGTNLSYEEMYGILYEEGMLHPKAYGISAWYAAKWFKRKVNEQDVQESEAVV